MLLNCAQNYHYFGYFLLGTILLFVVTLLFVGVKQDIRDFAKESGFSEEKIKRILSNKWQY